MFELKLLAFLYLVFFLETFFSVGLTDQAVILFNKAIVRYLYMSPAL